MQRLGPLTLIFVFLTAAAGAQPVAIEHQDASCFVAGQFPVLDACFAPGPGLARARVYFRPEGTPNWYYVEASTPGEPKTPEAACRKATLPKPKKALLTKHVEYYVEAMGKGLESSQTETYRPLVVAKESECKSKLVAPFVPTAVVQVFPSLPAAFAVGGGLSTAAAAVVVGAGVAATTGTVVAVANNNDNPPAPTTQPSVPTTQPPVTTVPPTTAPTTTLPPAAAFNPVFKVFRNGVPETATTISGVEPLQLRFFMCESTGPLPLKYNVLVNGVLVTAGCDSTITFTSGGFAPGFGGVGRGNVRASAAAANFSVDMRMQSDGPQNNPKETLHLDVTVDAVPPPTTTTTSSTTTTSTTTTTTSSTTTSSTTTTTTLPPCKGDDQGPTALIEAPLGGSSFPPYPVQFMTDASDAGRGDNGVSQVDYYAEPVAGFRSAENRPARARALPADFIGQSFDGANSFLFNWDEATVNAYLLSKESCGLTVNLTAVATDGCAIQGFPSVAVQVTLFSTALSCVGSQGEPRVAPSDTSGQWVSQLEVTGGRGQVVVNGNAAFFPASGRALMAARSRSGENRVEATLVQGTGKPGLWRIELGAERNLTAGTLRVIAGQVALITADAVVFRMRGLPGERVVFTFRAR